MYINFIAVAQGVAARIFLRCLLGTLTTMRYRGVPFLQYLDVTRSLKSNELAAEIGPGPAGKGDIGQWRTQPSLHSCLSWRACRRETYSQSYSLEAVISIAAFAR